jgi:hypothetical protein
MGLPGGIIYVSSALGTPRAARLSKLMGNFPWAPYSAPPWVMQERYPAGLAMWAASLMPPVPPAGQASASSSLPACCACYACGHAMLGLRACSASLCWAEPRPSAGSCEGYPGAGLALHAVAGSCWPSQRHLSCSTLSSRGWVPCCGLPLCPRCSCAGHALLLPAYGVAAARLPWHCGCAPPS